MPLPRYRGRLIFPVLARIHRFDQVMTALDPDVSGPLTSGLDADFREPVRIDNGTQGGASARAELAAVELPVQVEDEDWMRLQMGPGGNDPVSDVSLVFHVRDLERHGLVDADTGRALCPSVGDRLSAFVDPSTLAVIEPAPGAGLFCVAVTPRSYGLSSRTKNLLVARFAERGKA